MDNNVSKIPPVVSPLYQVNQAGNREQKQKDRQKSFSLTEDESDSQEQTKGEGKTKGYAELEGLEVAPPSEGEVGSGLDVIA